MLKLARIFQSGMTVQRNKPVKLWGESDSNQMVAVALNEVCIATIEVNSGSFEIDLPPQPALFDATLTVAADSNTIVLHNVDFGEVWIAGGQSNMEFPLAQDVHGAETILSAADEHLRFYDVGKFCFEGEESEGLKDARNWNKWMCFSPGAAGVFSAVGFYFSNELREKYKVPIAVVGCNWGGTTALTWVDKNLLAETASLRSYVNEYDNCTKALDFEQYIAENRKIREWMVSDEMKAFQAKAASGHITPLLLLKAIGYQKKLSATLNQMGPHYVNRPGALYDCMVRTIAGYTCAGIIWYQGENDEDKAELYDTLLSKVIACWRKAWKSDLPFLVVQLAPFGKRLHLNGDRYPMVRQKQELVSKTVPGVAMVCIMDVGEKKDIHPKNKRPVGQRLALMAMGKVYGEACQCESPELVGGVIQDGCIVLQFQNTGDGLVLNGKTVNALCVYVDGKRIQSYQCGVSKNTVTAQSSKIQRTESICVEFAQMGYCVVNLHNSAGLPVKPFRWNNCSVSPFHKKGESK